MAEGRYPKVTTDPTSAVPASPKFPEIEERVLAYWKDDDTFQASIDAREAGENGANEFVFYDGPPFANGLPHYGHLLTGYVKDIVPRYQTMKGRRVERRFGWDTHGLPAELEAMKQLGITTTDEIQAMGIDVFNDACRASVMKYADVWEDYVTRQARWVDFEHDYKTLNPEYMESVIWAFKSLFDKGLIYEGFRVLPYCWNDETPLSNHELRMDDDVYKMRQDPAVTVGLSITTPGSFEGVKAVIWTTTPWTLPANLAIMVGEEIEYVVVESDVPTGSPERYLFAAARLSAYKRELFPEADEATITWRGKGSDLVGLVYEPPFSYYEGHANAFRIVAASDAVTTDSGSGLVHSAGAFGEIDKEVVDREGIEAVMPVGKDGKFTAPVEAYKGLLVFEANKPIIQDLKNVSGPVTAGTVLVRQESYEHSYPHCWRCRQPLIYKGVSSWFVEVTAFKERMLELNQQIRWTPEHIKDGQFGKWLENARDWSITRNRFWGSPVPVWKSDNEDYPRIDVYGSFEEIERDFGRLPLNAAGEPDLHRPWVDDLTRPNPDDPTGQSTMRRVADVLDVWFDSGSMSFAQNHYPFENAEWFHGTLDAGGVRRGGHFPADFIVEYIGQTRGWFYMLHILATSLFDKPAFQSCISHGIVLGSDGQKMSKSLRNYPDVSEVFDRDGADAMRWFLMASPILRGGNLVVTEQGIRDSVRQVMIPLWNSWYFFSLYANAASIDAEWSTDSADPLDRYILAKAREFVGAYTTAMDGYAIAEACEVTGDFIDVLTNWYIRRSRDRFWSEDRDAFNTLYTVLEVTTRTISPLLPLVSEEIWRGLTGERSVHLADLPTVDELPADDALVAAMDAVRDVCSTTSALRKARRLRNRLPLGGLTVVGPELAGFEELVADEVNVKSVRVLTADAPEAAAYSVEQKLTVNARAAGPRLGKDVQLAIKGSKSGDWSVSPSGEVVAGGLALVEGEYTLETVAGAESDESAVAMLPGGGFVVLDTVVTPELASEGLARDLIRAVQNARKEAGLDVSDRISLVVAGGGAVREAATTHGELIARETLATSYDVTDPAEGEAVMVGDGESATVSVTRA
ncbi:isoleucine--tRNA ligase [Nocardioides sp. Kera G14]|uniref:isoleucine--tRNA ligase n=1 Tax=Nocardioides sp. Kera G14 TaxID=2884264 RepID=UPI001D12AE22|nr:isoleucine--tRNA ligase [Nocardioides sp. Kera G14]UDY22838.1 isoleucine--tRNA ligase [Nocardioides sp. Kera G14]